MPAALPLDQSAEPSARPTGTNSAVIDLLHVSGKPARSHLEWAEAIARNIGRYYKFRPRSQEVAELVQVAHLTLVRRWPRFSPELVPAGGDAHGQFRGWAHPHVRGECDREAKRLRNGGTYRTRSEKGKERVCVVGLPTRQTEHGVAEVDLADHRISEELLL